MSVFLCLSNQLCMNSTPLVVNLGCRLCHSQGLQYNRCGVFERFRKHTRAMSRQCIHDRCIHTYAFTHRACTIDAFTHGFIFVCHDQCNEQTKVAPSTTVDLSEIGMKSNREWMYTIHTRAFS